ncbi:HAD family hydrolase [Arenicellales bacterium IMCC58067]
MEFNAIILDCDGVILDSNKLKSQIMCQTVAEYGPLITEKFINYHQANGGLSRYKKFDFFLRTIVNDYSSAQYQRLLSRFSNLIEEALLTAPLTNGALNFIQTMSQSCPLFVVSGSDQVELHRVFNLRGLDKYFQGIFGSPTDKIKHCRKIISDFNLIENVVLIGDSSLDFITAQKSQLNFIFISGYTELRDWTDFCNAHNIPHYRDLSSLSKCWSDKGHKK